MPKIRSKDYHDYFIKDGKFIGAFEEMYQNVDDPWHHGNATAIQYDLALYLIKRYKICAHGGYILDIGCGRGTFTARVKRQIPKSRILAGDIAPTAIRKARDKFGKLGIDFKVMDIQNSYQNIRKKFDLIIISQLMWCILPKFSTVIRHLRRNLKSKGYLLINQAFYKPGKQKYGNKIISSIEDMLRLLRNYKIVELIEIGSRLEDHNVVVLLKPKVYL